ncbi:hypothetical protein SNEBB_002754 [Seison nebaliae]|nr:hypothetical protein SNEBB_002754 [Seison nebaliae]
MFNFALRSVNNLIRRSMSCTNMVKCQKRISNISKYELNRKYEKFSIPLNFDLKSQKLKDIEKYSFIIVKELLKNADPAKCVLERIKVYNDNQLIIDNQHYFKLDNNVHVAAFGRSVLGACYALQDLVGDHLKESIISTITGYKDKYKLVDIPNDVNSINNEKGTVRTFESEEEEEHNTESKKAAVEIHQMLKRIGENDILFVIISGGGSSLVTLPAAGISLEDITNLHKILKRKNVTKTQLNFIRKTLSLLKGGQLIKTALPAKIIGLIISDVIDMKRTGKEVASSPTIYEQFCPKLCKKAAKIEESSFNKPGYENISMGPHQLNEQMKKDGTFPLNIILTDNVQTIEKTIPFIEQEMGYLTFVVNTAIDFHGNQVGKSLALLSLFSCSYLERKNPQSIAHLETEILKTQIMSKKRFNQFVQFLNDYRTNFEDFNLCLMMSGKPTYELIPKKERGVGGVNQAIILHAGLEMNRLSRKYDILDDVFEVNFASFATKGKDGNSQNAGAYLSSDLIDLMVSRKLSSNDPSYQSRSRLRMKMENKVIDHLKRNDSGTLIDELNQSIKFDVSPTNVMTQTFILIQSKPKYNEKSLSGYTLKVTQFIPKNERKLYDNPFINIYINNFGYFLDDESLLKMFEEFGEIISAVVMKDNRGRSKGFGFINFTNWESAEKP